MPAVTRYRAVILDWRGILVHSPPLEWWVTQAFALIGRPVDVTLIERAVAGLSAAADLPDVIEAERTEDCSVEQNRAASMLRFQRAGLDEELAQALYRLDLEPSSHPLYPDVPKVLEEIRELDARIAVVSDIHFDLRLELASNGVGDLVDAYVLSFEHGFQKPDPRMFTTALDILGFEPGEALMVGDRATHDGGAASVGIDSLILPPPADFGPRGLDVVLSMLR
jgi:HAD superfamily hydrolase (TIGR01493 family)